MSEAAWNASRDPRMSKDKRRKGDLICRSCEDFKFAKTEVYKCKAKRENNKAVWQGNGAEGWWEPEFEEPEDRWTEQEKRDREDDQQKQGKGSTTSKGTASEGKAPKEETERGPMPAIRSYYDRERTGDQELGGRAKYVNKETTQEERPARAWKSKVPTLTGRSTEERNDEIIQSLLEEKSIDETWLGTIVDPNWKNKSADEKYNRGRPQKKK